MPFLQLMRAKHWLKNLLVLFPLAFSGHAIEPSYVLLAIAAFVSFSLASSSVYIFNDLRDLESDRAHPRKRNRPIANGSVSVRLASVVSIACLFVAIVAALRFASNICDALLVLGVYVALNVGYSIGWKNVPVVDIAILASGFVLRILFGGAVCGIGISSWLLLTILALSVFFALGKRRGELLRHGPSMRKSLEKYTQSFLDKNLYMYLGIGLVFYSLWTFERIGGGSGIYLDSSSLALVLGIPIVMIMCLRYSMDIESSGSDGDPMEVITGSGGDRWLAVCVVAWCIDMAIGLYIA